MGFRVVNPDRLEWITRPHEPDEPQGGTPELSGDATPERPRELPRPLPRPGFASEARGLQLPEKPDLA